jgi:serine/threonine protein kinase
MPKAKLYGGRWKIGDGIGQGGQGHVFKAYDATGQLPGEFALKRVLNPERHVRFRNEIEAIKRLSHPNVVKLIDHSALSEADVSEERAFLVMPIAAGGDLSDKERLTIYKGSIEAVLNVAQQIANATEAAHVAGVIHRDIKPQNILFTGKGHDLWITDFGICLIRGQERPTELGEVVGPYGFMAPELENGGQLEVSPAVDVYSLGKVIFYMLSGGVILPRETVHDGRYDALFNAGERAQRLRFLLGQMISPLRQRLQTMNEVAHKLQVLIDWERDAHVPQISQDALAGIEELRRRAHQVRIVKEENESVQEQEKRALDAVKDGFENWVTAELALAASRFGSDDNIQANSGEVGDTGKDYQLRAVFGNQGYQTVTSRELRLQTAEDNFQRVHRLRVQLCKGPMQIVTINVDRGASHRSPAAMTMQDQSVAMIPVYFQTVAGRILRAPAQLALAGFLVNRSEQENIHGQIPRQRHGAVPVLNKVTRTFVPGISQCTPFKASEWLAADEILKAALKDAIDTFIEFVLSGAHGVGP